MVPADRNSLLERSISSITLIKRHHCYPLEMQTIATLLCERKVKLQRNPGSVAVGGDVVCFKITAPFLSTTV